MPRNMKIPMIVKTMLGIHMAKAGEAMPRSARSSPPMRPIQYTAKMALEAAMTSPNPPLGKRVARGAPRRTKTRQAKASVYFLWISTFRPLMALMVLDDRDSIFRALKTACWVT